MLLLSIHKRTYLARALVSSTLLQVTVRAVLVTSSILGLQQTSRAQNVEGVAKTAQAITVRIEGATQGSGVIVKRDGTRYTVLTAWHVVSGQRPAEELDVYTSDGQRHQVEEASVRQLGSLDLAVLSLSSTNDYRVAEVADSTKISIGSVIYVSGYPRPTSSTRKGEYRFEPGIIKSILEVPDKDGYQMLYSSETVPGMSGGPVLGAAGLVVGIHGRAETESIREVEEYGLVIKRVTGIGMLVTKRTLTIDGLESETKTETSTVLERQAKADWRSYGPLKVDWANWQMLGGSYVAPALNSDEQPFYLGIDCDAKRLNATGLSGAWKTWDAPQSDFEQELIDDLCKK